MRMIEDELLKNGPIDPDSAHFQAPLAGAPALPHLPLYSGIGCVQCPYVAASTETMRKHWGKEHAELMRRQGRPCKTSKPIAPRWRAVSCQRLFAAGFRSGYFEVISPAEIKEANETMRRRSMANSLPEADYIRMQIDEALEESDKETRKREDVILDNAGQTEVSQWLEMTRWPKYLQGYSFGE
ncbi:hypothetical protein DM02DRAFT_665052, partial [Periconia macrospinosa]